MLTNQRRRLRLKTKHQSPKNAVVRRASSRLAAKASSAFVDMTSQAMHRKALLNSLSGCSPSLKTLVSKRSILSRNKLPIGAKELRMLTSAAGLDGNSGVHAANE
jgi:hypothetical protein